MKMLQKVYDAYTIAKCNVLYFNTLFVTNLRLAPNSTILQKIRPSVLEYSGIGGFAANSNYYP